MKITTLVCAGVIPLLVGSAQAQYGNAPGTYAYPHGKMNTRQVKKPRAQRPAPPRDPSAAYWKDPSRYEFPSWGLRGGW